MLTSEPFWLKILFILACFIFAVFAIWLGAYLRRKVWQCSKFKSNHKKIQKIAIWFNDRWGLIVLLEILVFFIFVVFVATFTFGTDKILESMVFGAAVVVFLTFQLPRLLKPNVNITLLPYKEETSYTPISNLDKPVTELKLTRNTKHHIFIYITNLGINNYEKCGCWLAFEKSISIVRGQELTQEYERLEWHVPKWPLYHAEDNSLAFEHTEALNFGPGDNLIREAYIKTPNGSGKYYLDIEITSSTRWGSTVKRLYLDVAN